MIQTLDEITLNDEQERALSEILDAYQPGREYLLTGPAGTGKTTVVQKLVVKLLGMGKTVAVSAPTHKAVAVASSKLKASGIDGAECLTIHSLLSLRPKMQKDVQYFVRSGNAPPVMANVVIIDESSMLGMSLMNHIKRHLRNSFVLFVGDPAQLPPVGEGARPAFDVQDASHLSTIVRQAADNPVIAAAHAIRASQGGDVDWSWARPARLADMGVYLPGNDIDRWMQRGFVSDAFANDPDHCRYLCWTNARVHEVSRRVRRWLYEDRTKPFSPGERALFRAPLVREGDILIATNEEPTVKSIEEDVFRFRFPSMYGLPGWVAEIPAWRMEVVKADGMPVVVHGSRDPNAVQYVMERAAEEAHHHPERWEHRQEFKTAMAEVQSIYAMTVHVSQGSTFRNAFVDVRDIRQRERNNRLEMQRLLYTAATRPSHALVLHGAPAEAA